MWQGECPGGGSSTGACFSLSAFLILTLPLSFSTTSLSLHSFPLSPRYPSPFFMLSPSLSLGFPLCFSFRSVATLHSDTLPALLPLFFFFPPPSTQFPFSPRCSLSPSLQLGTALLCQRQLPCFFSCGAANVSAVLWRSPNKRIFSFRLRDGEGLRCCPERSTLRWLPRLHPAPRQPEH